MKTLLQVANEMFPDTEESSVIDRSLFYNGGVQALMLLEMECEKEGIMTKKLKDMIRVLKSE